MEPESTETITKALNMDSTLIPSATLEDQDSPTESFDATRATHSLLAGRMVDRAIQENPTTAQDPALANALRSLTCLLRTTSKDLGIADLKLNTHTEIDGTNVSPSRIEIYDILSKAKGRCFYQGVPGIY